MNLSTLCLSLIFPPLSFLSLSLCYSFSVSLRDALSAIPHFPFLPLRLSSSLSPSSSSRLPPLSILFLSIRPPPPCLEGPMGALWFVCWKAYRHRRRHHWNLSLFSSPSASLARSLAPSSFSSSLSPLSLFSLPLFNVEVLSNCWLLLWLGGNGIFRRMPHAVALTHSRVAPNHTHELEDTNKGAYQPWSRVHKSGASNADILVRACAPEAGNAGLDILLVVVPTL